MSQLQRSKVSAWIGSAWYRDCDPFLSVAINPQSRYGKSKQTADDKLERLAIHDATEYWRSCDSGETKREWLSSVCLSGCFLEAVELNPEQLEDFNTAGIAYLEGF